MNDKLPLFLKKAIKNQALQTNYYIYPQDIIINK
ncbi:hypothetical protein SAMN05216436_105161 [bacterium A37T11]|nr:hypothetical protein SAMN05216436_105161 [bacterium A37T11]